MGSTPLVMTRVRKVRGVRPETGRSARPPRQTGRAAASTNARRVLHGARSKPVADLLQPLQVLTGAEPVVQRRVAPPRLVQLPLRPLVPIEAQPDGEGGMGVCRPKGAAPLPVGEDSGLVALDGPSRRQTSVQLDGAPLRRSSLTRPSRASFFRCEWTDWAAIPWSRGSTST
jgi:hypothetical protein